MNEEMIKTTVFERPKSLIDTDMHYCPGCGHGVAHRLITEVIDEMGIQGETIGVAPVGCSVFAYNYINVDFSEAAHGRASAVATGIKRVLPDKFVFSYQGDGDLAAIGTGETIHTCNRGENILIIFINNGIYGMTGGQMAPTTLPGMKTTTSPYGRDVNDIGHPIKVCELLNALTAPYYIERVTLFSPQDIMKAKKAVKKALQYNKEGKGFTFVEFLSTCPTNWGMTPIDAMNWGKDHLIPMFPVKKFRDLGEVGGK